MSTLASPDSCVGPSGRSARRARGTDAAVASRDDESALVEIPQPLDSFGAGARLQKSRSAPFAGVDRHAPRFPPGLSEQILVASRDTAPFCVASTLEAQ